MPVVKVREAITRLLADGWYLVSQEGSHQQYKHPVKPGKVTVAGKPSDDLTLISGSASSGKRAGARLAYRHQRSNTMKYAIVIERAPHNYGAYVPDLPGCVATGATVEETITLMHEAIEVHLAAMRADGDPIPAPSAVVAEIDVADVA
ncbi:MAG TPA: type II toxin-antitoxin system HicB family antitoxin [Thermomicrobiales bacterium]|jgi:predicted RNase H-like HicB family nuclease/predicted RNA binding protein YcfA (HicA-like mRNA interferase family)|nr:type II toxin-antitoxin system HicB family antitoxin [Thermomicrobiales bacterium]